MMTSWSAARVSMILVLVLTAMSSPASATTVLKVDLQELTRTSEWVVRAHVRGVANVDLRDQGDERGLYTDVTLDIAEVIRGEGVPSTYVLRMMGGVGKDGLALTIPGMPRFAAGEEVVLFLEKTGGGHVPCGLGQGVWRIVRPPVGPALARQSVAGLNLMTRGVQGALDHAQAAAGAMTLDRLRAEIRAVPALPAAKSPPRLAP